MIQAAAVKVIAERAREARKKKEESEIAEYDRRMAKQEAAHRATELALWENSEWQAVQNQVKKAAEAGKNWIKCADMRIPAEFEARLTKGGFQVETDFKSSFLPSDPPEPYFTVKW